VLLTQSRYGNCWTKGPPLVDESSALAELPFQDFWRFCFRAKTLRVRHQITASLTQFFNYWQVADGGDSVNGPWEAGNATSMDVATFTCPATSLVHRGADFNFYPDATENPVRLRDTLLGPLTWPIINFQADGQWISSGSLVTDPGPHPESFVGQIFKTGLLYKTGDVFQSAAQIIVQPIGPQDTEFPFLEGVPQSISVLGMQPITSPVHNNQTVPATTPGEIELLGQPIAVHLGIPHQRDNRTARYSINVQAEIGVEFVDDLDP
jgi:hypothetical protein